MFLHAFSFFFQNTFYEISIYEYIKYSHTIRIDKTHKENNIKHSVKFKK